MTISTLATANSGGGFPRKKSWKQSIKEGVLTGAGIGLVVGVIFVSVGTWGDYPTRKLVKTEARMLFSPGHVVEAKVLHGGKTDPGWLCWGPGHPVHACRPFSPDKDMLPSCIEPMSSFPASFRPLIRQIYGGTEKWDSPHPCRGIRIAEVPLPGIKGVPRQYLPPSLPEWVMPDPGK